VVYEFAHCLVRWRFSRHNLVDLTSRIKGLRKTISEDTGTAIQVLQFLQSLESSIPNTEMVCMMMLTVPVTLSKFSKLKYCKTVLFPDNCSTKEAGRTGPFSVHQEKN
jgi:hypothetical protein